MYFTLSTKGIYTISYIVGIATKVKVVGIKTMYKEIDFYKHSGHDFSAMIWVFTDSNEIVLNQMVMGIHEIRDNTDSISLYIQNACFMVVQKNNYDRVNFHF
jgi:hypothetical protein